jgi:hypothetical protein
MTEEVLRQKRQYPRISLSKCLLSARGALAEPVTYVLAAASV